MNIYEILSRDPQVRPEMLTASFWIDHSPNAHDPLVVEPSAYNQSVYTRLGISPVVDAPDVYTQADVLALIQESAPKRASYLQADGSSISPQDHPAWQNAIGTVPPQTTLQFGLALHWTSLRGLPTWESLHDESYDFPTDYLQESSIDVGWPVAIIATSADGQWYFCLTPLYWGWLPVDSVALGTREQAANWHQGDFVTVLSSRALIGVAGGRGVTPQMGTTLPLLDSNEKSYQVAIPAQNAEGRLIQQVGYAACTPLPVSHVREGYLPPTRASVAQSAFELLGERYAWGDSRMGQFGRDCSRLVKDIYATIGITLARNADQQESTLPLAPSQTLTDMQLGDLLFIPGHVMFCLGVVEGMPYILHAFGRNYKAVVVTSIAPPQAEKLLDTRWTLCRLG